MFSVVFSFLTVQFWVGLAVGATFPVFFSKVWSFIKSKVQTEAAPVVATLESDATRVQTAAETAVAKVNAAIGNTPPSV